MSWGREHFAPVQYYGYDVGPYELTVTVREGESVALASARAMAALRVLAEAEFREKSVAHLERIGESIEARNQKARR